jgi:hypothetical protein
MSTRTVVKPTARPNTPITGHRTCPGEADRLPTSPGRSTVQSFHYFPDLPPELRLRIWAYTVGPSITHVNSKNRLKSCNCSCDVQRPYLVRRPIATLHANRESRGEAIRVLTQRAAHSQRPGHWRDYVDFRNDIFLLSPAENSRTSWENLGLLLQVDYRTERAREMVLMTSMMDWWKPFKTDLPRHLARFTRLRRLTILYEKGSLVPRMDQDVEWVKNELVHELPKWNSWDIVDWGALEIKMLHVDEYLNIQEKVDERCRSMVRVSQWRARTVIPELTWEQAIRQSPELKRQRSTQSWKVKT